MWFGFFTTCNKSDTRFSMLAEKSVDMLKSMLGCCKVYISESRNRVALEAIERSTKLFPDVPIVNKFEDVIYNRVGYTLVSKASPSSDLFLQLKDAVFTMVKVAFESVDLGSHSGSHPRLGVVDHICFHPLGNTPLELVSSAAKSLADEVGSNLQVPAFLYGAAHPDGKSLDSIRRELGYFSPNSNENEWTGSLKFESLKLKPDKGPQSTTNDGKGVIVIGATRWVDNYNVPVYTSDMKLVRRIARMVSARGGGLPSVQSMALVHGQGVIEVACNLLEPSKVGGDRVQLEVERLANEEKLVVGKGYYTDFSQEKIVESYIKLKRT